MASKENALVEFDPEASQITKPESALTRNFADEDEDDNVPITGWKCRKKEICPYRHLSWITPLVTIFALMGFLFPAFRCSLTVQRSPFGDFEIWYGYWNLEDSAFALEYGPEHDSNVCVTWNKDSAEENFDAKWKFGKAVGVIGAFTCIFAAIANCFLIFVRFELSWFIPMMILHVVNSVLSFLLLTALASDLCALVSCVLARAGYVAIIAGFLWMFGAILYYFLREKEKEFRGSPNGVDLTDIGPNKKKKR